jgi:predicted dehydrogenase
VVSDLCSHLLDTVLFLFGDGIPKFRLVSLNRFETKSPDHVILHAAGAVDVTLEAMLTSWRNDFHADVYAEAGSAHIQSLCKWGPATFVHRRRVLPSGRPPEESVTLVQDDPTWALEYEHFKRLCRAGGPGNLANDRWIEERLGGIEGLPA